MFKPFKNNNKIFYFIFNKSLWLENTSYELIDNGGIEFMNVPNN